MKASCVFLLLSVPSAGALVIPRQSSTRTRIPFATTSTSTRISMTEGGPQQDERRGGIWGRTVAAVLGWTLASQVAGAASLLQLPPQDTMLPPPGASMRKKSGERDPVIWGWADDLSY